MRNAYWKKRKQFRIPDDQFVRFDIPLALEHESRILRDAGFAIGKILDDPDGAAIIIAEKE